MRAATIREFRSWTPPLAPPGAPFRLRRIGSGLNEATRPIAIGDQALRHSHSHRIHQSSPVTIVRPLFRQEVLPERSTPPITAKHSGAALPLPTLQATTHRCGNAKTNAETLWTSDAG